MTIIDREPNAISTEELERIAELEPVPEPKRRQPFELSGPGRILLASLSAAAGVIHLVMVPSHAGAWLPEGLAFAVAGWLQIGLAVFLVTKPTRAILRVSCLANAVFIAAWAVTRIWGMPFGPHSGSVEAASFVDGTCVLLEVALVIAGYELLVRPDRGSTLSQPVKVMLSVIPVGIFLLATMAIASPGAANHAHGDESALSTGAGAGHSHDASTPTTAAAGSGGGDGHAHGHDTPGATPGDDKGLSQIMNGAGEGGGHVHDNSIKPVDAATQAQLDAQLAAMKPFIDKYPTVKDAEAAGYHRQGPFAPALGAHYSESGRTFLNVGPTMSDEALKHPMLIYDGVDPDSKLAGFMYNIFSTDTQNAPEGFAGPNDHWHYHTNVCIVPRGDGGIDAPLGADQSATKELCDKYGGMLIKNTGYMVHVWPVPGYESAQGLFSNLNSKITCPNGTYYIVAQEETGTRKNVCKDVPA